MHSLFKHVDQAEWMKEYHRSNDCHDSWLTTTVMYSIKSSLSLFLFFMNVLSIYYIAYSLVYLHSKQCHLPVVFLIIASHLSPIWNHVTVHTPVPTFIYKSEVSLWYCPNTADYVHDRLSNNSIAYIQDDWIEITTWLTAKTYRREVTHFKRLIYTCIQFC
jgi:hypothetical protein